MLFGNDGLAGAPAAAEDKRQLLADDEIVLGDEAGLAHAPRRELHRCVAGIARDLDIRPWRTGRVVGNERQGESLCVVQEPLGIHADAIGSVKEAEVASVFRRGRYFGHSDELEDPARITETNDHLFAPATRGYEADTYFDQSHVEFGRGLSASAVHHPFTAAAQDPRKGRGDDRLRRVLQSHARGLEAANRQVEFVPIAVLRGQEQEHEIRADTEVFARR